MAKMSAQALRTAVIQAVTTDADFASQLAADPQKAITDRFGEQSLSLRVEFEKEKELSFLVPNKTEGLSQAIARTVAELGERPPTRGEFESTIIHQAWTDPAFLTQLRTDAHATLDTVLKKHGISVPAGSR